MDYKEHIEYALEYIEANLKSELNLANLAKAAGYSEYHFLRVFKQVTHFTPADYIRKRRLSEIAREIERGNRSISDIAFEYGFNSKENFTRAFKSEHGILPKEYKSIGNSLKLYGRLRLGTAVFEVTPKIVTLDGFSLTVYPSNEENPPLFWNQYNCKKLSLRLSGGKICADYGVCHWNNEKKRLDYFIGIRTSEVKGGITGTIQIEVPSGRYALFKTPTASHFDFVNTINRTWSYINDIWLPQCGYRHTGGYELETYVEAGRTFSEKIYIPIVGR